MFKPVLFALGLTLAAAFPTVADDAPRLVKLVSIGQEDVTLRRNFFGRVAARETVDIAFQVSGQVVSLPVIEGINVAKGEVIAALDLEIFELDLQSARLRRDQAERKLARLRQLAGTTVSQVAIDDAGTELALARVAVKNAEYALDHATLTAPYDALVSTRYISNFTTISAGTRIARLHDMSELRIKVAVPEVLYQASNAFDLTRVELEAKFPGSDETFPVALREFEAETSEVGQSFIWTMGMTPPEGRTILPGSSVTIVASLNSNGNAFYVPPTALRLGTGGGPSVLLFEGGPDDEAGTLRQVPVEIRPDDNGRVLVTSGLEAGAEIVALGVAVLEDGQTVRRFAGFAQ
ncbi:MAG TPA: efflux RND transporter periplasmic adaptor subunit [Rhodobacteraceae bacterium]|nr:efflux RND transporter periplasmic adaptor subunit [Paracoccaceae bacterium]